MTTRGRGRGGRTRVRHTLTEKYLLIPIFFAICGPPFMIAIACSNCYEFITKTDFNPVHYHKKRKENARLREEKRIRDERLDIVGRQWEKSREGRRARKGIPDELQERNRQDGILWEGDINQQDDSSLCSLPKEVRDLIWKELMGGYSFHFIWLDAYKRFDVLRCKGGDGKCIGPACHGMKKSKGVKDLWGNVDLLGHLLVCRKMYEEILPLLYKENYFQFIHISNILRFSLTIPLQQLFMIQKAQWIRQGQYYVNPFYLGENDSKYSALPNCKSISEECYCFQCWKREDWQKHYLQFCPRRFIVDNGFEEVCHACWSQNPAFKDWQ